MKIQILFFSVISFCFASCAKEDVNANHMQHGSGRWKITSLEISSFDTSGVKISDTTLNDVGEFIFMQSKGTDALYGYYTGLIFLNLADGTKQGYAVQWMNDGHRFNVIGSNPYIDFNKVYTVVDDKGKSIELVYATTGNASITGTNMGIKEDMILTYEPGYKN